MSDAISILDDFGVEHEVQIVSAHRTPDRLFEYAQTARSRGLKAIIAGAGGAAHLPGMLAAKTSVPVFGVPVPSAFLNGLDSLLSIVQMPRGVPVGALAVGEGGSYNAALLVVGILSMFDDELASKLDAWRGRQSDEVPVRPRPAEAGSW
jgi:5-(carboxyamino)imidazole ribonucleotide mutase